MKQLLVYIDRGVGAEQLVRKIEETITQTHITGPGVGHNLVFNLPADSLIEK